MRAPPAGVEEELINALSRAKGLVVDGLQRDLPLYEHLRRDGLTTDSISRLADMEGKSRKHLELSLAQDFASVAIFAATPLPT